MKIVDINSADIMALLRKSKEHRFFKNSIPKRFREVKGAMINLTCRKGTNLDEIKGYAEKIISGLNDDANIVWTAVIKDNVKENTAEIMIVK